MIPGRAGRGWGLGRGSGRRTGPTMTNGKKIKNKKIKTKMHQKLQFIFVRTVLNLRRFKYSQPFLFSQIEITLQFGPGYLSPSHAVYMSTDISEHRIFGESLAFFKIKTNTTLSRSYHQNVYPNRGVYELIHGRCLNIWAVLFKAGLR